jgi:hypothetical protein
MNQANVRKKRRQILQRIKDRQLEVDKAKMDLCHLQDTCEHPKARSWSKTCYDGSTDHYWVCDDCGKMKTS